MEKNYSISASCVTVGELRKLLKDLPQDYRVNFCGEDEGFINVIGEDGYVTLDHTNEYMDDYIEQKEEYEVKDGDKVIGAVYYETSCDWGFVCDNDGHEEQGFARADKAEDALVEYYYSNIDEK